MERTQKVFAALSDPTRRKVIEVLHDGDSTLLELSELFPFSFQALSKHINVLESAGLIGKVKKGKFRVIYLRREQLTAVLRWVSFYSDFWNDSFSNLDQLIRMSTTDADKK